FNEFKELYEVILPEGLKIIGKWAFRGTPLDEILLPSTLESIGQGAFAHSNISEIIIPDNVTDIKNEVFYECFALKKVTYSKSMTYIPNHCFFRCYHLESFDFHEGLESIGGNAFEDCYSLGCNAKLPESMKSIGYCSFRYAAIDSLFIPEGVGISDYAFIYSTLRYAELPTTYYDCSNGMFDGCSNLKTIKFKSPTKITHKTNTIIDDRYRANITLLVPDFLVSAYKLDSYWYNYGNIEGFPTTEISEWTINNPLVLDANSRFQGSPDIHLNNTSLTMNGETGMEVNEFRMSLTASNWGGDTYPYSYSSSSQVLVSADVDIKSLLELDYQTYGNRWYFISLPFDIKVSDIKTDAQYAIRYYDGANRAQTGVASGNWKNYSADDIVPAGTGFAFQTSKDAWNTFVAYENVNKNRAFKAKDLSAALDENLSETSEHRGWNFVGNPWMTFYNIHSVDFTAPITVYDHYHGTYKAYSIIDDDVALHPTQAFFVQCPEDVSVITFPARGRQLTKDITNQNGGKLRGANAAKRNLVDLEIKSEDASDNTRIVVNEEAVMGYDYGSDATKFFADSDALQLYSLDSDGAAYAINERPASDGFVDLAFIAPKAGEYTLSLTRNQMGTVILTDMETGRDTDITLNDYVFSTEAGSFTDRFRLSLFPIDVTGIEGTRNDKPEVKVVEGGIDAAGHVSVFSVDGRKIAEGEGVLYLEKGTYVVRAKSESVKVVVK
ncbi:MAG: leucine-rich repeat domain-containing protein, partial [Bacteroidaceae bacterium]|nr:leucine-rich repeat domain-containing protein [Bacteroidaceae bacterium]